MRSYARGFVAVIALFGIIALAITAPIGQLTFVPLILLTGLFVLVVMDQGEAARIGVIEVRTINATPDDYADWHWPTEKDYPWIASKEGVNACT